MCDRTNWMLIAHQYHCQMDMGAWAHGPHGRGSKEGPPTPTRSRGENIAINIIPGDFHRVHWWEELRKRISIQPSGTPYSYMSLFDCLEFTNCSCFFIQIKWKLGICCRSIAFTFQEEPELSPAVVKLALQRSPEHSQTRIVWGNTWNMNIWTQLCFGLTVLWSPQFGLTLELNGVSIQSSSLIPNWGTRLVS